MAGAKGNFRIFGTDGDQRNIMQIVAFDWQGVSPISDVYWPWVQMDLLSNCMPWKLQNLNLQQEEKEWCGIFLEPLAVWHGKSLPSKGNWTWVKYVHKITY